MTDEEFLGALESCELPESQFGHAAHVRAAYLYLQRTDFVGALDLHSADPGRHFGVIYAAGEAAD